MPDLITNLVDLFLSLWTNTYFLTLLINIVVSSISHYFAGRNALKPNKLKIRQIQLERVYLPLYRMLENVSEDTTLPYVSILSQNMGHILDENYEFVFPQLHVLHKELVLCIEQNKNYGAKLMEIKHQVSIEYDLLKKFLGYPSESFFNLFIRMTFNKRLEYLLGYMNIFWLFAFILFCAYNAITQGSSTNTLSTAIFLVLNSVMVLLNIIHIRTNVKREKL